MERFLKHFVVKVSLAVLCIAVPVRAGIAAEMCVSTTGELSAALNTAGANNQDDVIRVVLGTYAGVFSYSSAQGHGLTLEGGYLPACLTQASVGNSMLTANRAGRPLTVSSTAGAAITISRLQLVDGSAAGSYGGGLSVVMAGGTFTLTDSEVSECSADEAGGIFIQGPATVTLSNNSVVGNRATEFHGYGGGIYVTDAGTVALTHNTINSNEVGVQHFRGAGGGGVAVGGIDFGDGVTSLTMTDNVITENISGFGGGVLVGSAGFAPAAGSVTLTGNYIADNIATDSTGSDGGGILVRGEFDTGAETVVLTGNTIKNNLATGGTGGGICFSGAFAYGAETVTLVNNLIAGNIARTTDGFDGRGGGVAVAEKGAHTVSMVNNTVSANETVSTGGGILLLQQVNSDTADIRNTIFVDNTASTATDLHIDNDADNDATPSTVVVLNNDFDQTAPSGIYLKIPFSIDGSNLNNADPLFADAGAGDFHLTPASPCVDTGTPAGAPSGDIEGVHRPSNGGYDMGAYEYADTFYVAQGFQCAGLTPCFDLIQDGIDAGTLGENSVIRARRDSFQENVVIDADKVIQFLGGWDENFTSQSGVTAAVGSLTISVGSMIVDRLEIRVSAGD